ncbi:phosphoglucomutase [Salipaludibacillus neizhouensis]|uniref:Phosphoglucomutase n=1 Tax=Salipaludibacillus neizhouensis TaxID=885475 RepID=A0A3A9KDQ8_9BACI|nr:phospho-sugar mutase [Salipaludibacillus neizhouensis]RKL65605.1 phosphoglucomutase [Salipaludibacillus neizhouensis]
MDWKMKYEKWKSKLGLDENTKRELESYQNNEKYLEDSFYKNLEFGTGGMRGEIGPGTNRMNIYTIRKAAQGMADFIKQAGESACENGVVIAHDNRRMSKEFALETACTFGANGIHAYLFQELRPTPELSFAVRKLQTHSGVMITASHNPPEYNGFKVYGDDGGQLVPEDADRLIFMVDAVEDELEVKTADSATLEEQGLLTWVLEDLDDAYDEELASVIVDRNIVREIGKDISIVFTPLHGAAQIPMMRAFDSNGFKNIHVVEEQAKPDTEFSTVRSPNPEEKDAFELAINLGEKVNADILIATDPDGDRVGLACKDHDGNYQVLSGNQTGALMLDYLLMKKQEKNELPENGAVIKTIVTSELGRTIASSYGVETLDVLTGFKFIGEKIRQFETSGEFTFLFGYEESFGYLIKPFVRDKDAIQAALVSAELAAYYKKQNLTVYDGLLNMYEKYGYYFEDLSSFVFKGKEGAEKIQRIMEEFRNDSKQGNLSDNVENVEDYQTNKKYYLKNDRIEDIHLPSSNVLKMRLTDGSWYCLRPSGTEPKIKCYFGVTGSSQKDAMNKLESLKEEVLVKIEAI